MVTITLRVICDLKSWIDTHLVKIKVINLELEDFINPDAIVSVIKEK